MKMIESILTKPELVSVLRRCGWFPERNIDIEPLTTPLVKQGFTLFEAAREFLTSFGNLKIKALENETQVGRASDLVEFNPLTALDEFELFDKWQDKLGQKLFPLGDWVYPILAISDKGEICGFAGTQEYYFIGESVTDSLERLTINYFNHDKSST